MHAKKNRQLSDFTVLIKSLLSVSNGGSGLVLTAASLIGGVATVVVSVTPPGGVNTAAVGALPVVHRVAVWKEQAKQIQ